MTHEFLLSVSSVFLLIRFFVNLLLHVTDCIGRHFVTVMAKTLHCIVALSSPLTHQVLNGQARRPQ